MIREIIKVPNKMLREHSVDVTDFGEEFQSLVDDMIETMFELGGVGLAAVQISELKNVIVATNGESRDVITIVNPRILSSSKGTGWLSEGCLSEPDTHVTVERPKIIFVNGRDRTGGYMEKLRIAGFTTRVVCHEIDHLTGILLEDHISESMEEEDEL